MPKCRHDMEAAWCGDCKAAKARRKGAAASPQLKKRAAAGQSDLGSASRKPSETAAAKPAPADAGAAPADRARSNTRRRTAQAGEVTIRKVAPSRPDLQRRGGPAPSAPSSAAAVPTPGDLRLVAQRRRGLADAKKVLAKAQRTGTGLPAARERLNLAKQRLRDAERRAGQTKGAGSSGAAVSADGLRVDPLEALTDRGGEAAPPHLDPDLRQGMVWVLRRGSAYHRRDCHVVESRRGAVSLTRLKAKALGLTRCEVCSPLA